MRKHTTLLLPLLALALTGGAQATQPGFALDRFQAAEAGSWWLTADSLTFGQHQLYGRAPRLPLETLVLKLGANVAGDPLVIGTGDTVGTKVVSLQSTATLGASITLAERLRIGLVIPMQVHAEGSRGLDGTYLYNAPSGTFALGDLRLAVHYRVLGEVGDAARFAVGVVGHVPTGDAAAYSGGSTWRVEPQALGAGELGAWRWAASAGLPYATDSAAFGPVKLGTELVVTGAAGYAFQGGRLLVGPEVRVVTSLENELFARRSSTYEPMLGVHYGVAEGWRVHAGAGTGIGDGLGSPTWRGVIGLQWAPLAPTVEPPPPTDRDGDGIMDDVDACPDVPGVASTDKAMHGCPLPPPPPPPPPPSDRDQDGIIDDLDACPDVPGVASEDPSKHGCPLPPPPPPPPADTDGDGITDDLDACPNEPGPKHADAKKNGCPVGALVAGELVLDNVRFKTDSDVILKESDETLNKVLATIQKLPVDQRFLIEGHTDDRGSAKHNHDLSARRAKSVVRWFAKKGVDAKRFDSAGYGEDRPIATNDTDEGRKANRRVEIHLVDSKKK
jgi:outer membrane protein OmpA-like peptidoglycan-associated protein